jgi:hypothetical protein
MIRLIRLARILFVFSCLGLCVSCGSSQPSSEPSSRGSGPTPTYLICFSSPTVQVVRLSGAFQVKPVSQVVALEEPWAKEFRRFLGQSEGREVGMSVTCTPVSSKDPQGAVKEKADSLRKDGHQVIETGWKYAN